MTKIKHNYQSDKNLIYYELPNSDYYELQNAYNSSYNYFSDEIQKLSELMLYISIGIALLCSLIQFNFIRISVEDRTKESGILRTMGMSRRGVFSIFLFESLIMALMNFIITIIICSVLTVSFNLYLKDSGLLISLFNLGYKQIGIVFILLMVISLLSVGLTSFNFISKKPIAIIRSI